MEEEEPEGPLLFPSGATPLWDQPGHIDIVVTELSEMRAVRALIRQLVPTGLCPPLPIVSRPQSSALFALFSVLDKPEAPAFVASHGLDEFPGLSITCFSHRYTV
jgi:hypothetical protein